MDLTLDLVLLILALVCFVAAALNRSTVPGTSVGTLPLGLVFFVLAAIL